MSQVTKEGLSTGLGYVGAVPFSENADRAEGDEKGLNINGTYGNFANPWKTNQTGLVAGVYLVSASVGGSYFNGIIENKGEENIPYSAYLGCEAISANTWLHYRACICNGEIELQSAQLGGSGFTKNTGSVVTHKLIKRL